MTVNGLLSIIVGRLPFFNQCKCGGKDLMGLENLLWSPAVASIFGKRCMTIDSVGDQESGYSGLEVTSSWRWIRTYMYNGASTLWYLLFHLKVRLSEWRSRSNQKPTCMWRRGVSRPVSRDLSTGRQGRA